MFSGALRHAWSAGCGAFDALGLCISGRLIRGRSPNADYGQLALNSCTEVGVKSPEHALVPALTLLSAESLGIRALRSLRLGTSMGLMGALTPRFDLYQAQFPWVISALSGPAFGAGRVHGSWRSGLLTLIFVTTEGPIYGSDSK